MPGTGASLLVSASDARGYALVPRPAGQRAGGERPNTLRHFGEAYLGFKDECLRAPVQLRHAPSRARRVAALP